MNEDIQRLRGVNLGGWLVLEKWMTPSLFTGIAASDEYGFCAELGAQARDILTIHRNNFITEKDFQWIAAHGLNAVRLPVGHWIFGDSEPYVGGIEYVDQALNWAETYGLKVIIDLHGAPGSQNGKDHSGKAGKIRWHKGDNIERTLKVLERLCERYAGVPAVCGYELLNEPSWKLGKRRLTDYYEKGYAIVRAYAGEDMPVIIPDAYKPKRWKRTLRGEEYHNVWLDVHLYQTFGRRDQYRSIHDQVNQALKRIGLIAKLQNTHPVIVGEWSATLPHGTIADFDASELQTGYRTYATTQIFAQYDAAGWFYWSYKTETGGPWSLRDSVERGWLPNNFD